MLRRWRVRRYRQCVEGHLWTSRVTISAPARPQPGINHDRTKTRHKRLGNVTRASTEPHAARGASWQGAPVITWTSENKPMNITQIMHSEYSARASRTARPMNLNLNQSRRETPRCVGAGAGAAALCKCMRMVYSYNIKRCALHARPPRTAHAAGQVLVPGAASCRPMRARGN